MQRILRAAEENFAERGLAGARTGAIARAARVNKALLYYYFSSKEELHRFTLNALFQQLHAQMNAALDQPGTPRQQLLRYVNGYFDFMTAHPNYPRLFERELTSEKPQLAGLVREHLRPLHKRLAAVDPRRHRQRRVPAGRAAPHHIQSGGHHRLLFCGRARFDRGVEV